MTKRQVTSYHTQPYEGDTVIISFTDKETEA